MPFIGVLGPDGRPSVLFDGMVRRDLFPYVARFVVDRVCAGNGWRFPDDLDRPECAAAVWEILWAGWAQALSVAPITRAAAATKGHARGSIEFKTLWYDAHGHKGRPGTGWWKWDELTLARDVVDDPPASA